MKQKNIQFSELLDTAATDAVAVEQFSVTNTISLVDAYEIQKLAIAKRIERGEKLSGIKLGFTSKAKMEQMGVHDLIWGRKTPNTLDTFPFNLFKMIFISIKIITFV